MGPGKGRAMDKNEPLTISTKCEICGEDKADTKIRLDPFMYDLYDLEIVKAICNECYGGLLDDI